MSSAQAIGRFYYPWPGPRNRRGRLRGLADRDLGWGLVDRDIGRGLLDAPHGVHVGRVRNTRGQLDDPKADDAVGDTQRSIEAAEQLRRRSVELQKVVLGGGLAVDRVGQRPSPPLVVAQELALSLDHRA